MTAVAPGTRLGPYEILAPLGAGGMGEVYRARDTRLDRSVAVKVLPSHLTRDPELRARFEREAKAVSSLNHPHICTLHDVGQQEGTDYLVMELVEGETLADRLKKGALPLEQSLRIGIEIADALDKAHRQGVIHRDLKPGNVMLTKSGSKLMDFGLAKLSLAAEGVGTISALPTAAAPLTGQGAILGTVPYMAPEQLEGKEADARTDLWAFGCLLYEMATGRRAFEGKSQASLISAIMDKEPPPISQLQPLTPPSLERLVKVCLAKDADDRFQMAHDVMQELKWIAEAPSGITGAPMTERGPKSHREAVAWVFAAAGLLAVVGLGTALRNARSGNASEPVVTNILPPPDSVSAFRDGFAVSPDGRKIVFSSLSSKGDRLLWIRSIGKAQPEPLADTAGAFRPFWSPDGKNIGFFTAGKLKRIPAEGGSSQIIPGHRALRGYGGSWGPDGSILVANDDGDILRVDAAGGQPVSVVSGKQGGTFPSWLPEGRRFLYSGDELFVRPANEGQPGTAIAGLAGTKHAEFVSPDRLLFRDDSTRVLSTQRVDLERGLLLGPRQALAGDVPQPSGWPAFSVSPAGALAYVVSLSETRNENANRLEWVDRSGQVLERVGGEPASTLRRVRLDPRREAKDKLLKQLESVLALDLAFRVEDGAGISDVQLGLSHGRDIQENEALPQVVVRAEAADGSDGHADHRPRLSAPCAVPIGPGGDVDRVLQNTRHGPVVFRSHEQNRVAGFHLRAKRDPGGGRGFVQVLVVRGKVPISTISNLRVEGARAASACAIFRLKDSLRRLPTITATLRVALMGSLQDRFRRRTQAGVDYVTQRLNDSGRQHTHWRRREEVGDISRTHWTSTKRGGRHAPYDQPMRPDDLRTLQELLRQQRLLSLGVVVDDLPVVGLLPFLAAPNFASLVVHASGLAPHTRGLGNGQPWSGVIAEPDRAERDALETPRLILRGSSRAIENPEVLTRIRTVWRDRHPSAAMTLDLADFTFFSLDIEGGRLIAGFARAINLNPEHLAQSARQD